ncbi:hypothetical protein NW762_005367 [Fusarium torreyae]|uniref:NAD-dependent epimerase/dehydratase domain-containing protein n=1 Tax=Fusarium torreyae TaxID=1237075 RepID=A0A9W8S4Z1_9HYPO|nr:hypothetical protein NW762_005367 [Fusarium torreyae]
MAETMSILIVGGTGMIGGYTALSLRFRGHSITLASRHPPKGVPLLEQFPFISIDYVTGGYTQDVLASFDTIIFTAGADVRHVPQDHPANKCFLQASEALVKFASLARDAGVKRFIHVGSFYPHIAPELATTDPYVRSRKLAADGIISLAGPGFHACSLDAPFVVGIVPGMKVPMFVTYTQYARGKLGIPYYAPIGSTNFISVQSLASAITAALHNSESVSGRSILLGDENLTFSEYLGLFFSAAGEEIILPALEKEHPLIPESSLYAGRNVEYEPDEQDTKLLGGYQGHDIRDVVHGIVREYQSL